MASMAASVLGSAGPEGGSEDSSQVVWPGNLCCRAHCLLLTEKTLSKLEVFHVPLKTSLEKNEQPLAQPSLATGWCIYREV